jgi:phytoene dehydrogenase-like protein
MREWDTIVIGSGAGGLTAAVALANQGQRVLVLEQHYLPGGWMQSFALGGYRFSPGVHYVGECEPGGFLRRLYEGLGVARDLSFCEMRPDGYDHLIVAGQQLDVPRGLDRWVERLSARFPHERAGLARYFHVVRRLAENLAQLDHLLRFPRVLALPFLASEFLRWGFSTQGALLDATIKDPLLRGFLAAQNGDHGLPPARVSMPAHAATVAHYANGAYYPRGGAKSIPRALIRGLRRRGGVIRLRTRVKSILVGGDRVTGVELEGGERLLARNVVSNADPHVTYNKLLPPGVCPNEQRKSRHMRYSVSLLSVFAAVDMDLRGRGYDSGNYWYYAHQDVAGIYERSRENMPAGPVEGLFLAITSLKDPGHMPPGRHTLEMFTFLPYEPWKRWEGTSQGQRGAAYEALKEQLADRLIAAADKVIPGLSRAIVYRSVGTPLTNIHYCESPFGCSYGTEKSPFQLGPFSYRTRAEIDGLHLCGASTLSHGIAGASISGLMAAQQILGARSREDLLGPPDGSLLVVPAEQPEKWLPMLKHAASAAEKEDPRITGCAPP